MEKNEEMLCTKCNEKINPIKEEYRVYQEGIMHRRCFLDETQAGGIKDPVIKISLPVSDCDILLLALKKLQQKNFKTKDFTSEEISKIAAVTAKIQHTMGDHGVQLAKCGGCPPNKNEYRMKNLMRAKKAIIAKHEQIKIFRQIFGQNTPQPIRDITDNLSGSILLACSEECAEKMYKNIVNTTYISLKLAVEHIYKVDLDHDDSLIGLDGKIDLARLIERALKKRREKFQIKNEFTEDDQIKNTAKAIATKVFGPKIQKKIETKKQKKDAQINELSKRVSKLSYAELIEKRDALKKEEKEGKVWTSKLISREQLIGMVVNRILQHRTKAREEKGSKRLDF